MTTTTFNAATTTTGMGLTSGDDGTLTIKTGATAGAQVNALTFAADGTPTFLKGGPCFSAYLSAAQSISLSTLTKLQANIEEFDTNSAYDNATNYRFTPLVAGYYQISGAVYLGAASGITNGLCSVYKNGVRFKDGSAIYPASAPAVSQVTVSTLVYLNGSTDYVELYGYVAGTGAATFGAAAPNLSYFQAVFVRGV